MSLSKPSEDAPEMFAFYGRHLVLLSLCGGISAIGILFDRIDILNVVMLYQISVVFVSLYFGLWPGVLLSVMNMGAFDFFFVPPIYTFEMYNLDFVSVLFPMLISAVIISRLVASLKDKVEIANDATEAKDRFLSNMSHEIRTPMNAISGMLQLLDRTALDTNQKDLLRKTESASRTMLSILNDILDFSKIENNQMQLLNEPFELDALLTDLSAILSNSLNRKKLELVFDVGADIPPMLRGDDLRLKQVLINLGGNAIKFTDSGSVVMRVRLSRLDPEGALLEFAVEDTGIGLTENQRARIFNSFNQAEPSITRRFGGTGLGLAISKRLIKLMIDNRGGKGAELDVESTPGRGSRFSFQILLGVENSGAGQTRKSPLEPGQTAWAWVLEPLPESREALARLLERLGYRARAFPNAESMKALSGNELASTWPELILLNDDSPEREKFLAFLANAKGNPPLCLPVTSSDTNLSPSVLCKPVTQHMLLQALGRSSAPENMIEQSNSRQRLAGLHILLVEDNPINQELALRLLMDEGALVNAVENGQLALDALDAGPSLYDLVLMDVQMPVLNGLEATRAIRRRGMRIPILGLTANAYDSDRQACLDSGMNDVSSKPFDFEKLIDLILHHANNLQAPPSPASAAAPRSADTPQAAAAAPQALLDMPAALANMNNNAALHVRLLRDFSPVAAALGEKILSQDAAGAAQARDAAHQLKSNCALIGATRLASISRDIEDALRRDPAAVLDGETRSRFARCLGETLDAVKTFLAGAGKDETQAAPGAGAGHSAGLAADLDKLAGLLAVQDMDSLDLFDALSARHGQALHGPAWDALRNAMRVFDTAAALDAIRQLRPPRQDAPGL